MKESFAVSVIIPVFNNWGLTRQCLSSLAENSPPNMEVIVVDNGSSDETACELVPLGQSLFGAHFQRIRFEENRNFAPACNAGARAAQANVLFFLNNDTIILPGWLAPLLEEFAVTPRLGAAGPLLLYEDGTVQHMGIAFWPEGGVGHIYQHLPASHALLSTRKRFVKALTGAALCVPRSLFLQIGGFDEGYINGFEDVDFDLRLVRQGYKLCCTTASKIIHLESKTPRRHAYGDDNSKRLKESWNLYNFIDIPDIVAQDGYCLQVMPELRLKISCSPQISKEYISHLYPFNAAACFSFLEEEPLWLDGYSLLGSYIEQRGEWQSALQVYNVSVRYSQCFSFDDYARITRVMKKSGYDTALLDGQFNALCQSLCEERYERERHTIMRYLALGSQAGKALLPLYEQAGEQARKLRENFEMLKFSGQ